MRFFLLFVMSIFAFSQQQQSFNLSEINIDGNYSTSDNMVLYTAGLQKGQVVSADDFRRSIKRLWQLGVFDDVQIYFDGELEDGIKITIEVKESPVLNEVVFKGNKKLKDKKLSEELDFQKGMRIKPNLISNAIRTLKKLYLDDGYYLADIKASLNLSLIHI